MGNGRTLAISTTIALIAGLGAVAKASAAENQDVYARDANFNLCFSTQASAAACTANETADVTIAPGDTVTWHFDGTQMQHNAQDADSDPPAWKLPGDGTYVNAGTFSRTFAAEGTYHFECGLHPQMTGTVTVGTPTPPPDDEPPPGGNPPPSSPPPTGGTHTVTPAPTPGTDSIKPSVRGVKLEARRRAVRVRFRLSEPATVTLRAKRGRRTVVAKRVQAGAGRHTVTLRSKRLKKGRYVVQIQARDAFGNRSKWAKKRLTLRR